MKKLFVLILFIVILAGCANLKQQIVEADKNVQDVVHNRQTTQGSSVLHGTKLSCVGVPTVVYLVGAEKTIKLSGVKPVVPGYKNDEVCTFFKSLSNTELKVEVVEWQGQQNATGWLYSGGESVNAMVVRKGWATIDENSVGKHYTLIQKALAQAKEAPNGYWLELQLAKEKKK